MNPFFTSLIGAGVRWVLTMLAARGVIVSDDLATQLIAAAVAIGTLAWSVIQKERANQALKDAAAQQK